MADEAPFFIIGSGRSGTTLLRLILSGHSRLHIPPETWFIQPLVQELPLTAILDATQVERAVDIITHNYRWPDMEIAADDLRRWAATLHSPKLVDVINLIYRWHLERAGKSRFGDKTPMYFQITAELATLYPGAKFIHLIRDGRDVAISWIDLDYERYYEPAKFEWVQAMKYRDEFLNGAISKQVLEVRYEDLVCDVDRTVRNICAFLGEDFEPAMLTWQDKIELVPGRERHIHGKLDRPVSRDAVGVWRQKLTVMECFLIESCLHDELRRLDYPLRFAATGWRPVLNLTGGLLRTTGPLLRRAIPYLQRRGLLPKRMYI
jgi:hypothetical protein